MPRTDYTGHCREWPSMAALREWIEGLGLADWELAEFDSHRYDLESDIEGMRRRYENMVRIADAGGGNVLEEDFTDQYLEWLAFPAAYSRKPQPERIGGGQGTGDSQEARGDGQN